jgi:hypothetical protein
MLQAGPTGSPGPICCGGGSTGGVGCGLVAVGGADAADPAPDGPLVCTMDIMGKRTKGGGGGVVTGGFANAYSTSRFKMH